MDSSPSPASSASPSTSSSVPYTTFSGLSQAHQNKYNTKRSIGGPGGRRDLSSPGSSLSPEREGERHRDAARSASGSASGYGYGYPASSMSGASQRSASYPASAGGEGDVKPNPAGYGVATTGGDSLPDALAQFEMDMHMAGLGFDTDVDASGIAPGEYRGNLQDMHDLLMQHGGLEMDQQQGNGGGNVGTLPTTEMERPLTPQCQQHAMNDNMLDFTTAMLAPELGAAAGPWNTAAHRGGIPPNQHQQQRQQPGYTSSGAQTPHAPPPALLRGASLTNLQQKALQAQGKASPMLAGVHSPVKTIKQEAAAPHLEAANGRPRPRGEMIKGLTAVIPPAGATAARRKEPLKSATTSAHPSKLNTPAGSTEDEARNGLLDGEADTTGWAVVAPPPSACNRLPILIRGIKRKGAKSRVETQIKMRISIVSPSKHYPAGVPLPALGGPSAIDLLTPPPSSTSRSSSLPHVTSATASDSSPEREGQQAAPGPSPFDKVATFRGIRLQAGTGMKRRGRKSSAPAAAGAPAPEEIQSDVLYLQTEVYCVDSGKRAYACAKCRARELKRTQTKLIARARQATGSDSDEASSVSRTSTNTNVRVVTATSCIDGSDLSPDRFQKMGLDPMNPPEPPPFAPDTEDERNNIIVFNCGPLVDLKDGECDLPGRVTCYCRHHKEKSGFRIVLNLRDADGNLRATGTTPPVMITDDHKTSGRAAAAASGESSAASRSARARHPKKNREGSVSTEDSRLSSSRSKPYDRKAPSDARSAAGSQSGAMSPRSSYTPHGLSMTPLHGRSMPGSPLVGAAERTSYFGLPANQIPGSGAITPSLLTASGMHTSRPSSPQALADALPAIHEQLAAWADRTSYDAGQNHMSGLGMDTGPPVDQWLRTSNGGDVNMTGSGDGSGGDVLMNAATFESMSLGAINGGNAAFGNAGNSFGAEGMNVDQMYTEASPSSASVPSSAAELDSEFSSMINFSPTSMPQALPGMVSPMYTHTAVYHPGQQGMQSPSMARIPTITRLVPAEGPTHGGIEVTVLGENFTPSMVCSFGNMSAVTVQSYGPTTLVCLLPPSSQAGPVAVTIRDQDASAPIGLPTATFTYQDVSDRKLMEMALTAVGLRVTGKVHGAVEIARRIMSTPQGGEQQQQQQQPGNGNGHHQLGHPGESQAASLTEGDLADELARSIYSGSKQDFESAIIRFLDAFMPGFSRTGGASKQRHGRNTAVNHVSSEGLTILHLAALLGMSDLVRLLVRADATVDIHDRNGFTALAFATIGNRVAVVKHLLSAGAKMNACSFSGATPHSIALAHASQDVRMAYAAALVGSAHGNAGHAGHARRASSASSSSLDGDNPSSIDDAESALEYSTGMSPRKITTPADIARAKSRASTVAGSGPKSDGSATPTIRGARPLPSEGDVAERPPPYNPGDAANWLHRTLSHLPAAPAANLKDYLPPYLWDKIPSAHVFVPNTEGLAAPPLFRPGEVLESQAWLAVPLAAWLHLLPAAPAADPPGNEAAGEQTQDWEAGQTKPDEPAMAPQSSSAVLAPHVRARRRADKVVSRRRLDSKFVDLDDSSPRTAAAQHAATSSSVVHEKKTDRMLFLFWLPILLFACAYTAITTVPVVLGRLLFLPVVRLFTPGH